MKTKYITLTKENIGTEHICCAFSDKKCKEGYELKKEWLRKEFDNGYLFRRLDERAKVFIEYVPAEKAWVPVNAPGYLIIRTIQGMRTRQGAIAIRHRRCPVAGKSRTGHRSGYIQIPFHERHQMASAPGFPDGGKTPQRFQPAGSETDVRCARALFQGLHEKWGMRGEKRAGRLLHQPLPVHRIPRPRFAGRCSPKQRNPAENNQTGDTGAGTGCPHPGHHIHAFPQRAVCHHRPQRMS